MSTVKRAVDDGVRRRLRIESKATFADAIAWFGVYVGPRSRLRSEVKDQEEEYCARRWLIAMTYVDRLRLPVDVEMSSKLGQERLRLPDMVLRWDDGEALGVEIRQATTQRDQEYRTRAAKSDEPPEPLPNGASFDAHKNAVISNICEAITEKAKKGYGGVSPRDLLLYVGSESGAALLYGGDVPALMSEVLQAVRERARSAQGFRLLHVLWGEAVFLDVFGNTFAQVDLSANYANDWWAWLRAQADHLRARRLKDIDYDHLAEELEGLGRSDKRALTSHLRNLLVHLLKWRFQPEMRTPSWRLSIQNARDEIEEAVAESPSFEPTLDELTVKQYPKAREDAANEMDIDADALPQACPFELDQILDRKFFPDANP